MKSIPLSRDAKRLGITKGICDARTVKEARAMEKMAVREIKKSDRELAKLRKPVKWSSFPPDPDPEEHFDP